MRDVERVEKLAADIEPTQMYPADWLTFRVTGFRPSETGKIPIRGEDKVVRGGLVRKESRGRAGRALVGSAREQASGDESALVADLISGEAILQDLSALSERLCLLAKWTQGEVSESGFVRLRELQASWRVSESTLKRLRRAGLVTRAALNKNGVAVGYASREVAERFAARHAGLINQTKGKRRVEDRLRGRIVREALRYARVFGSSQEKSAGDAGGGIRLSPHAIARRLAGRHGVSVEGVRQLLSKESATKRVFAIQEHRGAKTRLAMLRLHRLGVSVEELRAMLARRGEACGSALVRRDLSMARAELLREWTTVQEVPVAPRTQTVDAALSPRVVREQLNEAWSGDLLELVQAWRAKRVVAAAEEADVARAFQALRSRAFAITASLDRLQPSPVLIDEAESALRWASALHRKLVATQGRLVLETIDVRLQMAAEQLEVRDLVEMLRAGVRAVAESVFGFDPGKGGRLAGLAGLAIDRAVTKCARDRELVAKGVQVQGKRAQRVLLPGTDVERLGRGLVAWDRWLSVPGFVRRAALERASALSDEARKILVRRYGLDGSPPGTLSELQAQFGMSRIAIVRAGVKAEREARRVVLHENI